MPVEVRQMTPIKAPRGKTVHVTSLSSPGRTACGKKCGGWRLAPIAEPYAAHVNCDACKAAIFFRVKPRGKR